MPARRTLQKSRAGDHVERRLAFEPLEQRVDVARVMLTVAVDLHGDLVAALERIDVAALHRAADAEVERQPQHARAGVRRQRSGRVLRAIVDDQDVEIGRAAPDLADGARDDLTLVVCGNDGKETVHRAGVHVGSVLRGN